MEDPQMTDLKPGEPVDLTSCEREPIHTPGRIQSFAALLAVSNDWIVTHVSTNAADILGIAVEDGLGEPLGELLGFETVHLLRTEIQLVRSTDGVVRLFAQDIAGTLFNISIHAAASGFIFEFERAGSSVGRDDISTVQSLIARIAKADSFETLVERAARSLKALCGFDRVMVYRFNEDLSGDVIADARESDQESFLGLRYPAADIPAQARALYLRVPLRVMADTEAETVAVEPLLDPSGNPLDMSVAVSRAMSPIHIEYLRNMGVRASMSVSIIRGGKLWGLFACHHRSPRSVDFKMRTAIELFGQLVTYEFARHEDEQEREYLDRAQGVHDRLMSELAARGDVLSVVDRIADEIGTIIPFDGFAIYSDGEYVARGDAPSREEFPILAKFLNRTLPGKAYATDTITDLFPNWDLFENRFAGLLAIPISRKPRDYILLTRREIARSVSWGGDPSKPVTVGPHGSRLTPRRSFELWKETVRGTSASWTRTQLRAAEALRVTLLEVLLKVSDEAMSLRKKSEERQELLVAELNHRVRNILNLIQSLTQQTAGQTQSTEEFTQVLSNRISALARAHDQITQTDWGPASLADLILVEFKAYMAGSEDRLRIHGEDVALDPQAFSTMALVMHEMMTNSAKYGALVDRSGSVDVTISLNDDGDLVLEWKEVGGPPVQPPKRRGFGTTVTERSIPFELGGEADISFKPSGVEARFVVPDTYVRKVAANRRGAPSGREHAPQSTASAIKGTVLIVEDNMIIAMDAADHVTEGGADRVITVSTVSDALQKLETEGIALALLDISLGTATSLPVADALAAKGIPFVIASGYAGNHELTDKYPDAPILRKPYSPKQLVATLSEVQEKG